MKKVFEVLTKPSKLILLIASLVYVTLYLVATLGGIGGDFLPVLSRIIIFVITLAAISAIPVLLILKKDEAAKIVFMLIGGYWLVSSAQGYLGWAEIVVQGQDGLYITLGIFGFIVGLCLAATLVLLVLAFILKKEVLRFAATCSFAGAILFILVFFVLRLVTFIRDGAEWTGYLNLINALAAPVALFFGYLYFLGAPEVEFAKKEKAPKEEKKEEAPAEEPQEEQPAEEKAE